MAATGLSDNFCRLTLILAPEAPLWRHMAKQKRKLTPAQKAAKKKRQKEYMTIFINGKQKRVRRPPAIDGMDVDEFIRRNADPIWLHQNEMWEYIDEDEDEDANFNE